MEASDKVKRSGAFIVGSPPAMLVALQPRQGIFPPAGRFWGLQGGRVPLSRLTVRTLKRGFSLHYLT